MLANSQVMEGIEGSSEVTGDGDMTGIEGGSEVTGIDGDSEAKVTRYGRKVKQATFRVWEAK